MLEVRRLRLLHTLSTHGTVAAAAEALHVSASAVSQQLAALEREAGVRLYRRSGRTLTLTRAGQVLAARTQLVLDQLALAESELAGLRGRVGGVVRVAAFSTAAGALLPPVVRSLRAAHGPEPRLLVDVMEPEESLPALRRGEVDLALTHAYSLMPRPAPPSAEVHDLLAEPVLLALPADDALAGEPGPARLARFADRPWLLPRTDATCHEMTQRACGAAGFVPTAQAHCDEFGTMFALVGAGLGVALAPALAVGAAPPGVVFRELAEPVLRTVSAVTRHGADRHPAVRVVLDHLAAAARTRSVHSGQA